MEPCVPGASELVAWCRALPKVELHAHLNGSIRDDALAAVIERKAAELSELRHYTIPPAETRSLADVFDIFSVIYKLTTDADTVAEITREVLKDFAEENVVYLELRTTPRSRPTLSKRDYVATVSAAIAEARRAHPDMHVRLLLTIDRAADSAADALETVALAAEFAWPAGPVVGIDIAGNPYKGQLDTFLPALDAARTAGLRVTLHCGEILAPAETDRMLRFQPDRLGHCCALDDECLILMEELRIPLELCLTSNLKSQSVDVVTNHHFKSFYAQDYPVVLCTDDKGVFFTTLSQEYAIAAQAFNISRRDLFHLARKAVEYTFADDALKDELRRIFSAVEATLLPDPQ